MISIDGTQRKGRKCFPLFFLGPSLCLYLSNCKMRITIITVRKNLSPWDMGQ
jgi:hypothetical protein